MLTLRLFQEASVKNITLVRLVRVQNAMTQALISIAHSVAKISSPASIMLIGSLLICVAIGLRSVSRPS